MPLDRHLTPDSNENTQVPRTVNTHDRLEVAIGRLPRYMFGLGTDVTAHTSHLLTYSLTSSYISAESRTD